MPQVTLNQIKCIATICSRMKFDKEMKAAIISDATGGAVSSTKELTYQQAQSLIIKLQDYTGTTSSSSSTNTAKMIGKLLSYCHDINWVTTNLQGKKVADMAKLNEWSKKFSYLHKAVNDYTYSELPKLVSQFEAVYKSFLNKI